MFMRIVTATVVLWALLGWNAGQLSALAAAPAAHGEAAAKAEAEGHGGADAEVKPLAFQQDLALWTLVVFLVVLAILWRYAWKPIAEGLSKRESHILEEIAAAERRHAEARGLLEDYEKKLAAAGDEVRQMLDAARRDAEQAGAQIVQQARSAAQAERDRALAEIDTATAGALKELADRSASLAVELAGKIVGAHLDRTAHNRLIEQALAGFDKTKVGRNGGAN